MSYSADVTIDRNACRDDVTNFRLNLSAINKAKSSDDDDCELLAGGRATTDEDLLSQSYRLRSTLNRLMSMNDSSDTVNSSARRHFVMSSRAETSDKSWSRPQAVTKYSRAGGHHVTERADSIAGVRGGRLQELTEMMQVLSDQQTDAFRHKAQLRPLPVVCEKTKKRHLRRRESTLAIVMGKDKGSKRLSSRHPVGSDSKLFHPRTLPPIAISEWRQTLSDHDVKYDVHMYVNDVKTYQVQLF